MAWLCGANFTYPSTNSQTRQTWLTPLQRAYRDTVAPLCETLGKSVYDIIEYPIAQRLSNEAHLFPALLLVYD